MHPKRSGEIKMESKDNREINANELRKSGNYLEALQLYKSKWDQNQGNEFDAAGILHCLRKLKLPSEGLSFASSIPPQFFSLGWINLEMSWTIADQVANLSEKSLPLENIDHEAEKILEFEAAEQAVNKIAFELMKSAKENKKWDILLKWVNVVNPASLSREGLILPDGKKGWSFLGRWTNYKITALIETGSAEESVQLSKAAIDNFPNHKKFFAYNLFRAYSKLEDYENAEKAFNDLRIITRPDFYMFHEYGMMLVNSGKIDEGIHYLIKSVKGSQKPEYLVGYYADLGDAFKKIGKNDEARIHYLLAASVRVKNNWSIPPKLQESLDNMQIDSVGVNIDELISNCNDCWMKYSNNVNGFKKQISEEKPLETDVEGIIYLGIESRDYFFINPPDSEGIIGFKNELTENFKDRSQVIFDIVPSFNKKRNEWSSKAINVRLK